MLPRTVPRSPGAVVCVDTLQITLDEVVAEMKQESQAIGRARLWSRRHRDRRRTEDAEEGADAAPEPAIAASASPEEHIARLRQKIDRLGPVNMMAIDQFDELSTRHQFLTTQRKDLTDSIAATCDTNKKIDETSKQRFREAFSAIRRISGHLQPLFAAVMQPSRCSMNMTSWKAASKSSRRLRASDCRVCSCCRVGRSAHCESP